MRIGNPTNKINTNKQPNEQTNKTNNETKNKINNGTNEQQIKQTQWYR